MIRFPARVCGIPSSHDLGVVSIVVALGPSSTKVLRQSCPRRAWRSAGDQDAIQGRSRGSSSSPVMLVLSEYGASGKAPSVKGSIGCSCSSIRKNPNMIPRRIPSMRYISLSVLCENILMEDCRWQRMEKI